MLVSGDGDDAAYRMQRQILMVSNVHLVFAPGIRFVVDPEWLDPLPDRQDGHPTYPILINTGVADCSVIGGEFDLNNELVVVQSNGNIRGGAGVLIQGATRATIDGITMTNTNGAQGLPGLVGAPPDGIRVVDSADTVVRNCHFSEVLVAVNAGSARTLTVQDNRFCDLLDSLPAGEPLPAPDAEDRVLGGAFVQMTGLCTDVLIDGNQNPEGTAAFAGDQVGGSVVVSSPSGLRLPVLSTDGNVPPIDDPLRTAADPAHERVTVTNNLFRSNDAAAGRNLATGGSGDVIALKNVVDFTIADNTLDRGGEFGIVISHGSSDGEVTNNTIRDIDGSGIAIGAQNRPEQGATIQPNPEVFNISVTGNTIWGCGLDRRTDLGRYRATSRNSLTFNYPNALSSIRVWNARNVFIDENCVMQYRSSGLWVHWTFADVFDRAYNAVTELTIGPSNVFEPYRAGAAYDGDLGGQALADAAPYTGISLQNAVDPETGKSFIASDRPFVRGFGASRYIGPPELDPGNPWFDAGDIPEVLVLTDCLGANGRIDVYVANLDCDAHSYEATISKGNSRLVRSTGVLATGEQGVMTVTGRPDGDWDVSVTRDGAPVFTSVVTIAC